MSQPSKKLRLLRLFGIRGTAVALVSCVPMAPSLRPFEASSGDLEKEHIRELVHKGDQDFLVLEGREAEALFAAFQLYEPVASVTSGALRAEDLGDNRSAPHTDLSEPRSGLRRVSGRARVRCVDQGKEQSLEARPDELPPGTFEEDRGVREAGRLLAESDVVCLVEPVIATESPSQNPAPSEQGDGLHVAPWLYVTGDLAQSLIDVLKETPVRMDPVVNVLGVSLVQTLSIICSQNHCVWSESEETRARH